MSSISAEHIIKGLEPIWTTKTETASRVRGRVESILAFATTRGFRRGDNPARLKGHFGTILPSVGLLKGNKHQSALPYNQVGRFLRDLRELEGISADPKVHHLFSSLVLQSGVQSKRHPDPQCQIRLVLPASPVPVPGTIESHRPA